MRKRERDNREYGYNRKYIVHEVTCTDTVTNTSTLSDNPIPAADCWLGTYESITDVVVPNYHARSARGEIFNNPMTKVMIRRECAEQPSVTTQKKYPGDPCRWNSTRTGQTLALLGSFVNHAPCTINVSNLATLAGTQAQANIREPEFSGLVFIAELREVIAMFNRPVQKWQNLVRGWRRLKRQNPLYRARSVWDFVNDNWLAYRYGVLPLVYDINDAIAAVESLKVPRPERFTARGRAFDFESSTNEQIQGNGVYTAQRSVYTGREVDVRSGILYENTGTLDTFGVSLSQIPVAAWEVIPFSFVADWLVNVGSLVSALTPKVGVTVLSSWTVVKDSQNTSSYASLKSVVPGPTLYEISNPGLVTEQLVTTTKTRTPTHSVGFAYHPQPFYGDLGKKRIADSIALANGILKQYR